MKVIAKNPLEELLGFLTRLDAARIPYRMERNRDEALMVLFALPGERWEVEFFGDGHIELEIFKGGSGVLAGQEASDAIEKMLIEEAR